MSDTVDADEFLRYHGYPTVLAFQAAYGMKQDGINGPVTQRAMIMRSWCGVSDMAFISAVKWPDRDWLRNPKTYRFHSFDDSIPKETCRRIFREAWDSWQEVCGIRVVETTDRSANITIYFQPIDGPSRTLAMAELPYGDGNQPQRMWYDLDEIYVDELSGSGREVKLKNVVAHEVGHTLGCPHIPR